MGVINFKEWKCTEYYMESNKDLVKQIFPIVDGFLSGPTFIYKDKSYTVRGSLIKTSIPYFMNQWVLDKNSKLFFLLFIGGGEYKVLEQGDLYLPQIRYAVI